jgi:hypothetical protein
MDNLISQLEQLTNEIVDNLDQISFEELEQFVEQREAIIAEMQQQPASDFSEPHYRTRIAALGQYDAIMLSVMERLKEEAQQGIAKIKNAQVRKDMYEAVYTPDSIFFDRRK